VSVKAGADPTAQFTISPNPATVGAVVTFDGSSSVAGAGAITNFQWNFGDPSDPTIRSGNPQTHTYTAKGTYTITLTVTQTNGRTNSTSHTLLVQ